MSHTDRIWRWAVNGAAFASGALAMMAAAVGLYEHFYPGPPLCLEYKVRSGQLKATYESFRSQADSYRSALSSVKTRLGRVKAIMVQRSRLDAAARNLAAIGRLSDGLEKSLRAIRRDFVAGLLDHHEEQQAKGQSGTPIISERYASVLSDAGFPYGLDARRNLRYAFQRIAPTVPVGTDWLWSSGPTSEAQTKKLLSEMQQMQRAIAKVHDDAVSQLMDRQAFEKSLDVFVMLPDPYEYVENSKGDLLMLQEIANLQAQIHQFGKDSFASSEVAASAYREKAGLSQLIQQAKCAS